MNQYQQNSPRSAEKKKENDKACLILLLLVHTGTVPWLQPQTVVKDKRKQNAIQEGFLHCYALDVEGRYILSD